MNNCFNELTTSTGSLVNPVHYTARESDTETGLYYYRARYYDPTAGRFLSEDPAGFTAGMDFYTYVSNNSTNLVDPKGLLQVCCRPAHQFIFQTWAAITLQPQPCHCFLKTEDGHTLGGYFDLSSGGNAVLRPDDRTDQTSTRKRQSAKTSRATRARTMRGLRKPLAQLLRRLEDMASVHRTLVRATMLPQCF